MLSGAAIRVCDNDARLRSFLQGYAVVQQEPPVVVPEYMSGAREIEIDAVSSNGDLFSYTISELVKIAGCHSGDATLLLSAQRLRFETHRRVWHIAEQLRRAQRISGLFCIQYLADGCACSASRFDRRMLMAPRLASFLVAVISRAAI